MNIIDSQSLAAGATVNVLTGKQYEFLPFNALVSIALTGSAAGLVASVYAGTDLVQQEGPMNPRNAFPVIPDDYQIQVPVAAGTRLAVNIRNTTAGALTWWANIRLQSL